MLGLQAEPGVPETSATRHTRPANPPRPPWRLLGPLFTGSLWVTPSRVNRPPAMRLPYLPTTAPKWRLRVR